MYKQCKKAVVLLLALVMLLTALPFSVFAAGAQIVVDTVEATPGETVDIKISLQSNPGVALLIMDVAYDKSLLTLNKITYNSEIGGVATQPSSMSSPVTLTWYNASANSNGDFVFATLSFTVADNASENASSAITVTSKTGNITDIMETPVQFSLVSGKITVVSYEPGDINGDHVRDGRDLLRLAKYFANWDVEVIPATADVNGDGITDGRDLLRLAKFFAGWDVEIHSGEKVFQKCAHTMTAVAAVEATCTESGSNAYWQCDKCRKYFSDASGTNEITLADTVVAAKGHTPVTDEGVPATHTSTGLTEGSHCSVCGATIKAQEVIPMLQKNEYSITYHVDLNDNYLKTVEIDNPNPDKYYQGEELELKNLIVNGYIFKGWYNGQGSNAQQIFKISAGETGNKVLYAQWEKQVYTITFDSPDVPWSSLEYTVDTGKTLTNPKCFGYTFMGWSDDNGFIVSIIKPGTTGNMTLHANWTSDRNKATSYQEYGEPLIIEDDENGQFLFVYNIGRIDNVPLNEVEFIGKTESLIYKKDVIVTDKVDSGYVDKINNMVSKATTKSSGWTLSKEWNDIYESKEETGQLSEKTDERTTSQGTVIGGNYFVSNSNGGSTYVSTESGSSSSNSSKITTENSMGINASYDKATEKYCDAKLGVSNTTEASASVSVPVGIAKVSAGVKNTTTVSAEVANGRKDNTAFHVDGSLSKYVGTVNTDNSSAFYNSSTSNSSNWNSTSSYEKSYQASHNAAVTDAIKEQISKSTTYSLSNALGGEDSQTEEIKDTDMTTREYSTSLTYSEGKSTTTTKSFEFNSSESGYYRIVTAGTVHVYAVVGYDVATSSYFTYCYNVLDDTKREILDYSKDNMNFNDCENSVVTFEVPYEVNEYIAGVVGKTEGLEISYDGQVTGFNPVNDFAGTVSMPQYDSKNNKDDSFSAVKVTSFKSNTFSTAKNQIKVVILPTYITEIPDNAFEDCANLEIVIAYGVTKIGANAFKGCTSLKKFYIDNAIVEMGENAFEGVSEVSVSAYNSSIADAAVNCGAKRIRLNISKIKDAYDNKAVSVSENTEYFAFIGNGSTYNNLQITSNADETMISNITLSNNIDIPIKLSSSKVVLARLAVVNSPTYAIVLTAEHTDLKLLGTVSLSSSNVIAVISKNVTLSKEEDGTTSSMVVTGEYLVCGEVVNKNYLNVEPSSISETKFNNSLVSTVVVLNANGGNISKAAVTVYRGQKYGILPVPVREHYEFIGWYTEQEGGTLINKDTVVDAVLPQQLFAHWKALTLNLKFNPNGGSVSDTSKLVYVGKAIGELPVPVRENFTFEGWYKDDGTQVTKDTVFTELTDITLRARWKSGWVLTSEVPSGSEIASEKWTYNTIIESDKNAADGYTLYDTTSEWGEYGEWSEWSKTEPTESEIRIIEKKTVTDKAAYTQYKYWRYVNAAGNTAGTKGFDMGYGGCYIYQEIFLKTKLSVTDASKGLYGPALYNGGYAGLKNIWFSGGSSTVAAVTHVEYRYKDRELVYTYYLMKTEADESAVEVTASATVVNVQKWVQYIVK